MPRKLRWGWGYGKAPSKAMRDHVYANLGRPRKGVVVPPGRGLDNAVVSLPGRRVLIVTTDPVSVIPAMGPRLSAWLSVHLIASDLTTSGADPEFATFSYNFPDEMAPSDREEYLRAMGAECGKLGVAIVAGNTGTYPGAGYTVVGAGTMLGTSGAGDYVTPAMARAGDKIMMTKGAAIEAAVSLAHSFPKTLAARAGPEAGAAARKMLGLCTTVEDARLARGAGLGKGGVTSMHDATEGGVLGGLDEMASASGKRFVVNPEAIPVSETAGSVCRSFGLDPLRTMGEGALLLTCSPEAVRSLENMMLEGGIPVAEIGRVAAGEGVVLSTPGRRPARFSPREDGYWKVYSEGALRRSG